MGSSPGLTAAEALAAIIAGDTENGLRALAAALEPYLSTPAPGEDDGWR
jgi:hypothetical protein